MEIGVSFCAKINNCALRDVLSVINTRQYIWYIINEQSEVWASTNGQALFEQDIYNGEHFCNLLDMAHYTVFFKAQGYYVKDDIHHIHSIEDFFACSCQIIVLCYDCNYYEIYSKDKSVIKKVYMRALEEYENVRIISKSDCQRERFDIL